MTSRNCGPNRQQRNTADPPYRKTHFVRDRKASTRQTRRVDQVKQLSSDTTSEASRGSRHYVRRMAVSRALQGRRFRARTPGLAQTAVLHHWLDAWVFAAPGSIHLC